MSITHVYGGAVFPRRRSLCPRPQSQYKGAGGLIRLKIILQTSARCGKIIYITKEEVGVTFTRFAAKRFAVMKVAAVVASITLFFAPLSACSQGGHEHEFSSEWTCDSSSHWHAAVCAHKGESSDRQAHAYNDDGVCAVCGYSKPDWQVFYSVTFDANGGDFGENVCEVRAFVKNSPLDVTPQPVREGYAFMGWSRYSTGENLWQEEEKITCALTLYAVWKQECRITLCANGGEFEGGGTTAEIFALYGDSTAKPAEPKREGYLFTGWFTSPDCSADSAAEFPSVAERSITLYAGWQKIYTAFTVTYHLNYGGKREERLTESGTSAPFILPERAGYVFLGWFTDEDCTAAHDFAQPVEGEISLYAGWHEIITNGTHAVGDITDRYNSPEDFFGATLGSDCTQNYAFYFYFAAFSDGEYVLNFSNVGRAEMQVDAFCCTQDALLGGQSCPADGEWRTLTVRLKAGDAVCVRAYNAEGSFSAYLQLYVTSGADAD